MDRIRAPTTPTRCCPSRCGGHSAGPCPGWSTSSSTSKPARSCQSGEEGELLLRGTFLMDGFYKRERHETFTPDGWYATGDLGWFRGGRPSPLFWPPDGDDQDGRLQRVARRGRDWPCSGSLACARPSCSASRRGSVERTWPPSWCREVPSASSLPRSDRSLRNVLSSYKVPRHLRIVRKWISRSSRRGRPTWRLCATSSRRSEGLEAHAEPAVDGDHRARDVGRRHRARGRRRHAPIPRDGRTCRPARCARWPPSRSASAG